MLDRAAPGSDEATRAATVINRQVTQLTRLVDDLLDVTRIVSGKLRLQRARFDLTQMLLRIADDHRAGFADMGIALDVRDDSNDIWVWDIARHALSQVNRDNAQDMSPNWTPPMRRSCSLS